jgi:hypothetical protein
MKLLGKPIAVILLTNISLKYWIIMKDIEVRITMTLTEEQKKFILGFLQTQANKNPLIKSNPKNSKY